MAPWALAMLAWMAGVALQLQQARLMPLAWSWMACTAAVLMIAVLVKASPGAPRGTFFRPAHGRLVLICLACMLLGWGSTSWRADARLSQRLPASWQDQDVVVVGTVEGLPQPRGAALGFDFVARRYEWQGQTWDAASATVEGHALPRRLSLYASSLREGELRAGQSWRLPVRLQAPVSAGNPGGFDGALWLFDRGVRASGSVRPQVQQPLLLSQAGGWWSDGAVDRARQTIRDAIGRQVGEPRLAGVVAGLTVGDQAAIDQEDWNVFRKTGVAHLVSISGLHIAMVGWMAGMVLSWAWRRSERLVLRWPAPVVQLVGTVMAATLYAVLAGWGVPAQRTVCMMAVWAALRLAGRRWPWPLVWLLSAVVVTLMDPWALVQAGFWLSFVAVGVLMSSGTKPEVPDQGVLSHRARLWLAARSAAHTQWLATISLTPLAAVFFQQVSVVGFIANLLAIPVFTLLVTPLTLLGTVWPALWSAAAWLLEWSIKVLSWIADWPWSVAAMAVTPMWISVASVLAAWAVILPVPWRWRLIGAPAALALVCLPTSWRWQPPPKVGQFVMTAPDVGQGTAVLVRTAHHALLFDAGPTIGDRSDAGQRVLVPLLAGLGVKELDELLISHRDTDHVGGAASVAAAVSVRKLRSSLEDGHPLRQASSGGRAMPHVRCEAGQRWQWDGVDFEVLHPSVEDYARRQSLSPNALSCVLKISNRALVGEEGRSALLAADVEAPQEEAVLERTLATPSGLAGLHSTVLVAPHHGSKTSSTEAFLRAVHPAQTVVQAGRRNRYGHPAAQVMARYDALELPRLATPACGAFVWQSSEAIPAAATRLGPDHQQRLVLGMCWRQHVRHYWDD